jgi:hypothetical protein
LDTWPTAGPPDQGIGKQWLRENQASFQKGKRYQSGMCLPENHRDATFDALPDEARRDLYLRVRLQDGKNTEDWELETWPKYQRNPSWGR